MFTAFKAGRRISLGYANSISKMTRAVAPNSIANPIKKTACFFPYPELQLADTKTAAREAHPQNLKSNCDSANADRLEISVSRHHRGGVPYGTAQYKLVLTLQGEEKAPSSFTSQ
jgi:hypothetical protein